jgi:hypothetical protein
MTWVILLYLNIFVPLAPLDALLAGNLSGDLLLFVLVLVFPVKAYELRPAGEDYNIDLVGRLFDHKFNDYQGLKLNFFSLIFSNETIKITLNLQMHQEHPDSARDDG